MMNSLHVLRVRFKLLTLFLSACLFWMSTEVTAAAAVPGSELTSFLGNTEYPDDFWTVSTLKAETMSPDAFDRLLEKIAADKLEIHSLTVIKNGKLVADYYGIDHTGIKARQRTPADTHELHSTTKTLTSMLVGIAIDEGAIKNVHARAVDFFDTAETKGLDKRKKKITLEDLLTMRSGMAYEEGANDALFNLANQPVSALAFLHQPMALEPGKKWNYSSGNSQILSEIIRRTTGKTPLEYATTKIFKPIGVETPQWYADGSGTQYGGWGLFLRPRDLARFGYLLLNQGKWENTQLVPEKWVAAATHPHAPTPWGGGLYGYHVWIPEIGGFATLGYKGQDMFIFPDHNMVVVFTSELPYQVADKILIGLTRDFLLPTFAGNNQ